MYTRGSAAGDAPALERFAPMKFALVRFAPRRFAVDRFVACPPASGWNCAPVRFAPISCVLVSVAPWKCAPVRSRPGRSARLRLAPVSNAPAPVAVGALGLLLYQ